MIRFGRYQLDPTQGLTRGAEEIRVTPKSLAVLHALASRAGQVVTKDQLFETVWPGIAVTDSALTSCIQELRHALEDDARRPRYIETLPRRGYRFVARTSDGAEALVRPESVWDTDLPLVGRESVLDALLRAYEAAERGSRQMYFVSADAGMGKTRVVQAVLAKLARRPGLLIGCGQCVDRYGVGEPYQPLLEAVTRLCRQPGGAACLAALERYAPTWLAQLPGLLEADEHAAGARTAAGTTRERMMRELTNALEALASAAPVVICLEDLHWSDASTLDWIAAFAHRPEPARVLLMGTFRPASPGDSEPSPASVADALRAKGLCTTLTPDALDAAAVEEYVRLRFPPARGAEATLAALASRVRAHTGGHPLFVVNVLADLAARGVLVKDDGSWTLARDLEGVDLGVPDDIRRTIERRIERLSAAGRALLDAASVAGETFAAPALPSATGRPPDEVDRELSVLRQSRLVKDAGLAEWPDGSIGARFAFAHALYRDVVYAALPVGRRVELHRRIGERLEQAHGSRSPEIAAELAMHFDLGRDAGRAIAYLQHAAENARRKSALGEARLHFERALSLVEAHPSDEANAERELSLRLGLGAAIMATQGFGAPAAEAAYSRARALCQTLGDTPSRFPAVWGLWLFYWGRGDVNTAHELANELAAIAASSRDDGIELQARHASWATSFSRGDLVSACESAADGIRLYDSSRHAAMAATYGSHDAGVCARMFAARALALRGQVGGARSMGDRATALAASLGDPFSTALALTFRAALDHSIRDAAGAAAHARAGAAIAREQGFRLMLAWCSTIEGWADAEGGSTRGLETIARAIASVRASGSDQFLTYLLGTLAQASLAAGEPREALRAVDDGLGTAARTGEGFYEAELHRLHGEVLVATGGDPEAAEDALGKALEVARRQDAGLLALRAAVSLGRLYRRLGRADRAAEIVLGARRGVDNAAGLRDLEEAAGLVAREA